VRVYYNEVSPEIKGRPTNRLFYGAAALPRTRRGQTQITDMEKHSRNPRAKPKKSVAVRGAQLTLPKRAVRVFFLSGGRAGGGRLKGTSYSGVRTHVGGAGERREEGGKVMAVCPYRRQRNCRGEQNTSVPSDRSVVREERWGLSVGGSGRGEGKKSVVFIKGRRDQHFVE